MSATERQERLEGGSAPVDDTSLGDDEGRCLVCKALVAAEELGYMRAQAVPAWLLTGYLDSLEFAIADHIWQYGQHLPGVSKTTSAGTPTAVANMAMSVIRKNIRRFGMQR